MHTLHSSFLKITALVLLLAAGFTAKPQGGPQRNPLYDLQKVHFGFSIIGNYARLKFTPAPDLLDFDTMKNIRVQDFPGFGVGGIMSVRLGEYWDYRTMFNIQFAQRNMLFTFRNDQTKEIPIESTYLEIPMLLKYKSKRHGNTRFYAIAGITYRYDFASDVDTERSNAKPIVALSPNTFAYDIGFGLDFYFEFFKFSPELKVSNTFMNALVPDPYFYASSLKNISPKMIQFSLHFE
jgi:hypothetical protein